MIPASRSRTLAFFTKQCIIVWYLRKRDDAPNLVKYLQKWICTCHTSSGAGTKSKVGGEHMSGNFFSRAPPLLLALQVQLVVLTGAFVMFCTV